MTSNQLPANSKAAEASLAPILDWATQDVRKRLLERLNASGGNRHTDGCQIRANSDREAVIEWLRVVGKKSISTHRRYAGEARRFVAWLTINTEVCISGVTVADLAEYHSFLTNPQPESLWCNNPDAGGLGLMRGPLSERSANHAMVVIRSLYKFLADTRYIIGNPFAAYGKIKFIVKDISGREYEAPTGAVNEREVPDEWIDAMWGAIEQQGDDTAKAARERWVLALFSRTGVRRLEAVTLRMSDIYLWRDDWYLSIVGKGRKLRKVPLSRSLLTELSRYRKSLGLSPLPASTESDIPLISKLTQRSQITTTHLERIISDITEKAANYLIGCGDTDNARSIRTFTPHLFRRYFATKLFRDGADIVSVQSLLGHESVDTTRIYTIESNSATISAIKNSFD